VLEAVAAAPWGKKTAIVVTSDHGEAFGEHKMWRHGAEIWEELVRVPLIVHVPGVAPGHVTARRSSVDLVPTLLDLLGVPPPAGPPHTRPPPGPSSPPRLPPPPPPHPRAPPLHTPAGPNNDSRRALIHGDLKLTISNENRYEIYDLAKDPEERNNLWEKGSPE